VFVPAFAALTSNGVEVKLLDTHRNIWLRDFMAVRTGDHFTKFAYKTFGHGEYDCLRVPRNCWLDFNPALSRIVLDGGNVAECDSCVLMTKAIFRHNPKQKPADLVRALEAMFEKPIVLLPMEPGDWLGHADGIAHHIGGNRVLINDYSGMKTKVHAQYQTKIETILARAGLEPLLFPFAYHRCPEMSEKKFRAKYPEADDMNPAVGYYINMLIAGPVVLLPAFGFEEDAEVLSVAKILLKGKTVIPIDCFDLAMLGGLLHCCSWEHDEPTTIHALR